MEWLDDPDTVSSMDDLILSLETTLIPFLNNLHRVDGDNPHNFIIFTFGKFVVHYCTNRQQNIIPKESFITSVTTVANDPTVQTMISNTVGSAIHQGVTGDE
jgi:hypothetical protein